MDNLPKIASFQINHDTLEEGMYTSRIDGDVVTYDLRFVRPNTPPFMENAAMHTIEHLAATILRAGECSQNIIYFGPMGCRTGFYLLTRGISHEKAIELVRDAFVRIAAWEGQVPGTTAAECGNYLEHDLAGARALACAYCDVIANWTSDMLAYKP